MVVKLEEARFKTTMVVLDPCMRNVNQNGRAELVIAVLTIHGTLHIRIIVVHDARNDIVIVIAPGLLKVVARDILDVE